MIQTPTVISASAAVTTSATCAASLAADANLFWFCSGFEVSAGGATAGGNIAVTLTGLLGGTLNYNFAVPTGVTLAASPMAIQFQSALAGAAANTAVVLSAAPMGAGNTKAAVVLHGYLGARQLY